MPGSAPSPRSQSRPTTWLREIHDRMPAVLTRDQLPFWFGDVEMPLPEVQAMLRPFPSDRTDSLAGQIEAAACGRRGAEAGS